MDHIFLSDVHLGAFSEEQNQHLEQEITELIHYCTANQVAMHIGGDLFDYWMEKPGYVPPIGKNMLDAFEQYNRTIMQASFVTGNHDFWTLGHFENRGFNVSTEFLELNLGNNDLLFFHGDGLTDRKFGLMRPFLNSFLRNPVFVYLFRSLFSGKRCNSIMKSFSEFTRNNEKIEPARLTEWAKNFLAKSNYSYIVCGHDHVARIETYDTGSYINCGAFFRDQTVARYTNNGFELVVWDGAEKKFHPY